MPRENLSEKAAFLKSRMNASNVIFGNLKKTRRGGPSLSDTKTYEWVVTRKLSKELGGKIEVGSRYGKIDILTDEAIIEVKRYKSWKHALGQILIYSIDYPNHKKMLYLYGTSKPRKSAWELICNACLKFGVECVFLIEK